MPCIFTDFIFWLFSSCMTKSGLHEAESTRTLLSLSQTYFTVKHPAARPQLCHRHSAWTVASSQTRTLGSTRGQCKMSPTGVSSRRALLLLCACHRDGAERTTTTSCEGLKHFASFDHVSLSPKSLLSSKNLFKVNIKINKCFHFLKKCKLYICKTCCHSAFHFFLKQQFHISNDILCLITFWVGTGKLTDIILYIQKIMNLCNFCIIWKIRNNTERYNKNILDIMKLTLILSHI